jgi:hypothetical protein
MTRKSLITIALVLAFLLSPAPLTAQPAGVADTARNLERVANVVRDVARVAIVDAPLHTPTVCTDPIRLNGHMLVLTDLLATAPDSAFEQCVLMQGVTGQQNHTTPRLVVTGAAKMEGTVACDIFRDPPVCEIAAVGEFRLLDLDTKDAYPVTLQLNTTVTGSDVSGQTFRFATSADLCTRP